MNEKIRKDRIDINNLPEGWKQEATQGRSAKIFLTDESGEVKGAFCFGCRNYLPADNFPSNRRGIISICNDCIEEYREEHKEEAQEEQPI